MSSNPLALVPRRRLRMWLLLAGFFLGGAALGIGAILLGLRLVAFGSASDESLLVSVGLTVVLLGVVWLALLRPARLAVPDDDGVPVDQAAEPLLVAAVRSSAGKVGVRLPLDVVVTPGAGASCLETGVPIAGRRRCRVEIGIATMQALTPRQLEALLAMHLAHQADGDLRLRRELARTLRTLERIIDSSSATLSAPFRWYQEMLLNAWGRYEEVHVHAADAAAARVYGSRGFGDALRRTTILAGLFEQFIVEEVQPILDEGYVPADLYAGFRLCLEALAETEQLETMENEAAGEEGEAGFPSLGKRLAFLRTLDATVETMPGGEGPARSLLRDPAHFERPAASRWIGNPEEARPLAWAEVAEHIWAVRLRSAAAALRGALPPGTSLSFAIDWLAAPSQLALAAAAWPRLLDDEMTDAQRQSRARALVQRGVAGWIGEKLVARGWRWETSPGYAVELESPAGDRIAPLALLASLGAESDAAEVIRERLDEIGLPLRDVSSPARPARSYLH